MTLLEIKDIHYEEAAVYYRQKYEAVAVFAPKAPGKSIEIPLFFIIEISPLNEKKVVIDLKKNVDYPLIPIMRALRERILQMHDAGQL